MHIFAFVPFFAAICSGLPTPADSTTACASCERQASPSPEMCGNLQTVYQFPADHWIENLAPRHDGTFLLTDPAQSAIYLLDPRNTTSPPITIATFPANTSVTGIAELERDIFYVQSVLGLVYTLNFTQNSTYLHRIDMRPFASTGSAEVTPYLFALPEVQVPNGLTALKSSCDTLLMADSGAGLIYRVNARTGAYEVALDDPLLKPIPGSKPAFGVNEVKIRGDELYFSSSNQALLGKVHIDLESDKPKGPVQVIATNLTGADDFAIDPREGSVWLARNVPGIVDHVLLDGRAETVIGGNSSLALTGPVSATFGRGKGQETTLFITTDGLSFVANGTRLTSNGKVVSLETGCAKGH